MGSNAALSENMVRLGRDTERATCGEAKQGGLYVPVGRSFLDGPAEVLKGS